MGLETFNLRSRPQLFRQLSREPFDLLVIGGGITGASIFRDAAHRGMRVALVEAKDFAAGASGRSSKFIHGGLRYLKTFDFRLVWEACHERNLHLRLNSRLVRSLPFLIPLYRKKGESRALLRLGMWVYEAMSGFKNHRFHQFLSPDETLSIAPGLPTEGLTGGCLYYDATARDNRWTVETVKDGVRNGGLAVNHTPVTAILKENGKAVGAACRDEIGGGTYQIRARAVVNATGGFVDRIRALDRPGVPDLVGLSKGTHLVFSEKDIPLTVTTAFPSPIDNRPLFLARQNGCFLLGTSDGWEDTAPDAPAPGKGDVDYLLSSLRQFMPGADLGREKVRYVYSGFRPLLLGDGERTDSTSASREDGIEMAPSGLISVVGGKLTTARLMAKRVLKRVIRQIGRSDGWLPCRTHRLSLGGSHKEVAEGFAHWVRRYPQWMASFQTLYRRYGTDAHTLCAEAVSTFRRTHSRPGLEFMYAEFRYMCRHEMVCTLEDLIDRRAGFLSWNNTKRLERLRTATCVIRDELGLKKGEFEEQYREYQNHLKRLHTLPEQTPPPQPRRPGRVGLKTLLRLHRRSSVQQAEHALASR